jgi:His/Glu/Gln/Arg/opine family amino acid ABC transporter permease subunit
MIDLGFIVRNLPVLLEGLWLTAQLATIAAVFAAVLGFPIALARMSRHRPVRLAVGAYIEFFRNTPLLHQLFLVFFGLPMIGIVIPNLVAAGFALSLLHAAFFAEIYRSAIESIDSGQQQAGRALGMHEGQLMRLVIVPQALVNAIPLIVSQLVLVFKDSSLGATIGIIELTLSGRTLAERTAASYEVFIIVGALYLIVTTALGLLAKYLEKKFHVAR